MQETDIDINIIDDPESTTAVFFLEIFEVGFKKELNNGLKNILKSPIIIEGLAKIPKYYYY